MSNVAPLIPFRRKLVARLKADAVVTALLPAGRIYGERSDADTAWPFSRCGEFEGTFEEVTGNVHAFSKSDFTDEVGGIVEAISSSLDGAVIELADGRKAHVTVDRTRILPDPAEQSAWHGIVMIVAKVKKDCDAA